MKCNMAMVSSAAAAMLLLAASLQAGWIEQGDAGPFYQGGQFQETAGNGDLDTISGTTMIPGGVIPDQTFFRELVDVYAIRVTDPEIFYATTDTDIDSRASASDDSRLYLIDPATGNLLLMNDDTTDGGLRSLIAEPATFTATTGNGVHGSAQSVELVAGQTYLLAVAEFAITPLDLTGVAQGMFEDGLPLGADHIYEGPPADPLNTNSGAPDGNLLLVGAIRPATDDSDWGSNLQFVPGSMVEDGISYTVALRGATYAVVPEPGTIAIALLALLGAAVVGLRRKLG
jgi:hypothetical protein